MTRDHRHRMPTRFFMLVPKLQPSPVTGININKYHSFRVSDPLLSELDSMPTPLPPTPP